MKFAVRAVAVEAARKGDCCLMPDSFSCWYRHVLKQMLNENESRVVANENACYVLDDRNVLGLSLGNQLHALEGFVNETPDYCAHIVHLRMQNFHPWRVVAKHFHYSHSHYPIPCLLVAAMLQIGE